MELLEVQPASRAVLAYSQQSMPGMTEAYFGVSSSVNPLFLISKPAYGDWLMRAELPVLRLARPFQSRDPGTSRNRQAKHRALQGTSIPRNPTGTVAGLTVYYPDKPTPHLTATESATAWQNIRRARRETRAHAAKGVETRKYCSTYVCRKGHRGLSPYCRSSTLFEVVTRTARVEFSAIGS